VNRKELESRFPRYAVLVAGDLDRELEYVAALRGLGARVEIAGKATAATRAELEALGVDTEGLVASRAEVLDKALEAIGIVDIVVFGAGEWEAERKEIFEAERGLAAADGRSLRPLLARSDPRYDFLKSAGEWARFTLSRAVGADFEAARRYAAGRRAGGHKAQNPRQRGGDGGGKRAAAPRRSD
jgi:hypothetical protein